MKVAIDLEPLRSSHAVRGIGAHTRELVEVLKKLTSKKFILDEFDYRSKDNSYDVIHYTSFNPYLVSLPLQKRSAKIILTIHDLIPLVYPKHYPGGVKGKIRLLVNKYLIHKNVDAIITISETSKKDICRFLKVDPEKVYVIYLAAKEIFEKIEDNKKKEEIKRKYNLPDKFVLYVGDVNYNKNIPNLVKAARLSKLPLVICGKQAKEIEDDNLDHPELKHLKSIDWPGVLRLGYVPDEDLAVIYNLALVYCQPSFYEGFGLPVLEALSCGCPVALSKTQVLVEIAGSAATYFDPNNPKDIAEKLVSFNNKGKLPREYSWERAAKETLNLYEKI